MAPILLVLLALPGTQGSDVALRGPALDLFLKSRGRSHLNRDVHWHVPAKALATPLRVRRGWRLHRHRGIGILVPEGSAALGEIRRRGGVACIRGRVIKVPAAKRAKGDPAYAVVVRQLSRRKK